MLSKRRDLPKNWPDPTFLLRVVTFAAVADFSAVSLFARLLHITG